MKKTIHLIVLVLVLGLMFGCASIGKREYGPERRYGSFAVIKENKDVIVVVDVELAQRRKTENYFPLGIKVANKNLSSLTLDRESFVLIDENGHDAA